MAESVFDKPIDTAIQEINDKIGTVPSGETVEGQIDALNSKIATLWDWNNATVYTGTNIPGSITTTTECLISLVGQADAGSNYGYAFIQEASQGITLLMATTFIASGGFASQCIVGPNTNLAVYFGGDVVTARKLMIVNRKT